MSCEHCVKAVTKALSSVEGLEKVKINLKSGTAAFSCDPGKAGMDKIRAAVEEAGYSVII